MAYLNETMEDLRATMDAAAQKTCEALETSKWFVERLKLRNALNEKYRQLGKAQYLTATGESDESEQVDVLMAELTELRAAYVDICKLLNRGGALICPKCGKRNVQGNAYCADCGAAMATEGKL